MEYFEKVTVTSSPHVRSEKTIKSIMLDVIIALIPTTILGIYFLGLYSLLIVLVCIASCVLFELLIQKLLKKDVTINDLSAVVTGLLLGLNLPASVPLWIPVVGSFFAIVIVKQLFGGLGQNFMNPALGARAFLVASWPGSMLAFTEPVKQFTASFAVPDAVSGATSLALLKTGETCGSMFDVMIGNMSGCIGEVSGLALLLGGIYLIARKVITWHIPVIYISTTLIFVLIFGLNSFGDLSYIVYQLFGGGLLIGAIFMATDYASSPVTNKGKILFAFGCGLLTGIFRLFGASAEGVSYAILIMNLVVPLIDKAFKPKLFGEVKA